MLKISRCKSKDNIPYIEVKSNDYTTIYPALVDLSQVSHNILQNAREIGDIECQNKHNEMITKILDSEKYKNDNHSFFCVSQIIYFFSVYFDYISDPEFYEVMNYMDEDSIFGFIYYDQTVKSDVAKIFLTIPEVPLINRYILDRKPLEFKFTEDFYWELIEPYFKTIYLIFGGDKVSRKTTKLSERFHLNVARNYAFHTSLKDEIKQDIDPNNMTQKVYITIPTLTKCLGKYDSKKKTEMIVEHDNIFERKIGLFKYFETKKLADIVRFSMFQYYKILYGNNDEYVFQNENEGDFEY